MGRRETRETGVGRGEAIERVSPRLDNAQPPLHVFAPVGGLRRSAEQRGQAAGNRLDGCEGVVQLVTDHPYETLPGLALLFAQRLADVGQHEQLVWFSALPERSLPDFPPARSSGKVDVAHARSRACFRLESEFRCPPPDDFGCWPAEQMLAIPVYERELAMAIEREDCHVDLRHHGVQQGGCL